MKNPTTYTTATIYQAIIYDGDKQHHLVGVDPVSTLCATYTAIEQQLIFDDLDHAHLIKLLEQETHFLENYRDTAVTHHNSLQDAQLATTVDHTSSTIEVMAHDTHRALRATIEPTALHVPLDYKSIIVTLSDKQHALIHELQQHHDVALRLPSGDRDVIQLYTTVKTCDDPSGLENHIVTSNGTMTSYIIDEDDDYGMRWDITSQRS